MFVIFTQIQKYMILKLNLSEMWFFTFFLLLWKKLI